MDLAVGPYSGKETGENALLRGMLDSLCKGDVLVADRYYCSFMMIALLLGCGVEILTYCQTLLSRIASCEVADRPGRIEPRVIKRRRHRYRLMRKPRTELKAELQNRNSWQQ